jgi:uncharacterized protein (DUF433 family)
MNIIVCRWKRLLVFWFGDPAQRVLPHRIEEVFAVCNNRGRVYIGSPTVIRELDRITVNPQVCLGQPTIRGMRITVGFVLKLLASQLSVQEVLEAYPELEEEDIRQALNYAAWAVSDRIVSFTSA